ncbi:hypothetical protein AAFX24_27860 [Vibrio mediterranei]|uniref:hypothetical protein n=1 Tax=Vibrio mediterranei TaxID=689 RepID=UPI0038CECB19
MYFYIRQENDKRVFFGPFMLPKADLIEDSDSGKSTLHPDDQEFLQSTDQVVLIDRATQMTLDCELRARTSISKLEYTAVYEYFKETMSTADWCLSLGITDSQHWNLRAGRTTPNAFIVQRLSDMLICKSYIYEVTAFVLASIEVNGQLVDEMNAEEFGKHSLAILHALRNSYDLTMKYYWSHKTHLDVAQAHIYMQTHQERLESSGLRMKRIMINKMASPEFAAFRALPVKVKRNRSFDRDLVQRMLEHDLTTQLSPDQKEGIDRLLRDALRAIDFVGGNVSDSDPKETWELILGTKSYDRDYDYIDHHIGLPVPD